jgi:hypothetical protein
MQFCLHYSSENCTRADHSDFVFLVVLQTRLRSFNGDEIHLRDFMCYRKVWNGVPKLTGKTCRGRTNCIRSFSSLLLHDVQRAFPYSSLTLYWCSLKDIYICRRDEKVTHD